MQVQLTTRIVLNPYAAKRLAVVLNRVVAEYESNFGALKDDARPRANAAQEKGTPLGVDWSVEGTSALQVI